MSFSSFLSGRIGVLTSPYSYDGTDSSIPIIIDPSNGSIKCNNIIGNVNATVNLDSINANINTLFNTTNSQSNHIGNLNTATLTLFTTTNAQSNHIGNLNTSTLTLFTTTNSQSNTLDDHNEYFNDINVAVLGLDGAVEQAQNDIINLQSNINVLVNVDANLQNSINLLVNTDTNQQNQINGLILTDISIQNSINLLVNTDANLQNSINLLVNTDANLQNEINNLVNTDANLQSQINNISGITYQTFYANLGTDVLQTKINQLAGATRKQLIISPGAWTPTGGLTFTNLDTCFITGAGGDTSITRITPSSGGFTISGASSTRNQFRDLDFNDLFTIDGTQGRHTFINCNFLNGLTISGTTTNFLVFDQCDFSNGSITIPITFGAVVYFKACNFAGTTAFNFNNPMATQIICFACLGLNPVNTAKITEVAFNEINGLTQVDASIINCNDLNSTANINGLNGTFTDGTTTILIDPGTTKGIEIQNAIGQAKIKLVDTDGDEIEIQNTEIDVFHSASLNQTDRYYQFKDASGNQVDWYMGSTVPSHSATNGSLFVLAGASPSIYQYGSSGWATIGGGGGVVGSYNVPCAVRASMSVGQTIGTTTTKVLFDTMDYTEPAGWISNISSNQFTIPFSGVYSVSASINGTIGSNIAFAMTVVRNGTTINSRENEFSNAGDIAISIFYTDYFSAGDLVQINAQGIGSTIPINASQSFFSITGFRQDPLTISSTIYIPKIVKRIMSGTNVINTTPTQIFYLNPEIKTPNNTWITDSVNGEYTIAENGVYQISAGYQLPSPPGDYFTNIFIYKNGAEIQRDSEYIASVTTTPVVSIMGYHSLLVGDVIQIWGQNSIAGQAVQNQPASYFMVQKVTV